jgi:hypothetical protein
MPVKQTTMIEPLAPLDAVLSMVKIVIVTGFVFFAVAVPFGNVTIFNVGDDDVCVTTRNNFGFDDEMDKFERDTLGLRRGIEVYGESSNFCNTDPHLKDQVLIGLTNGPTSVVFIGFVLLTRRTIRYTRRNGLFSQQLAERIERLGWLLLAGLLGASIIEWLAEGLLIQTMRSTESWASGSFGISVPGIIGAYGLVSIGRIMNRAAALQAEADATI